MTKLIHTSIDIHASRETIWKILTDFEKYPTWNPFVKSLTGEVKVGHSIKIVLPGMKFTPQVRTFEEQTEFSWLGHLWFKGLFDGEHKFHLTDLGNGITRFDHSEHFKGILVGAFAKRLDADTKPGFEEMNRALKARAEATA